MAEPSVAVIIPTFNRAEYLRAAIESVIEQTRQPDEIVVVDDGSTDGTAEVCRGFHAVRRVHQQNQGQGHARNTGLAAVAATFICFLDDDDLLVPNAIEQQLAVFQANPEVDLVYGRSLRIDANGHPTGEDLVGHQFPRNVENSLFEENFVRIQTVMVRRDTIRSVGEFDNSLVPCEDYDLWLRLAIAGCRFWYLPKILARYRVHPGSVSLQRERMARAIVQVVEKNAGNSPRSVIANAHYRLGRTLLDIGNVEEALKELRTAVNNRPQSMRYRAYLMLAGQPWAYNGGFRFVQKGKRWMMRRLAMAGLVERRWDG